MNILMLNPPFIGKFSRTSRSPAITKGGTIYYPFWLAYATGVLERKGFNVRLIDAPAEGMTTEDVIERIKEFIPKLVILDTSTPSIYNDIRVGEAIRDAFPNSYIVLVGTRPSALPEETLQLSEKINAVATREYDYTLRDLAYVLQDKNDLHSNGLFWLKVIQFYRN